MHEYPAAENLVKIAIDTAEKNGARRVVSVKLVVGELTGFIAESIQFYFDILSENTLAAGARLDVSFVPAEYECRSCGVGYKRNVLDRSTTLTAGFICPKCGGVGKLTDAGRELYIESVEVEK